MVSLYGSYNAAKGDLASSCVVRCQSRSSAARNLVSLCWLCKHLPAGSCPDPEYLLPLPPLTSSTSFQEVKQNEIHTRKAPG